MLYNAEQERVPHPFVFNSMDGVLDLKLEVTHAIKIKKHNIIDNKNKNIVYFQSDLEESSSTLVWIIYLITT